MTSQKQMAQLRLKQAKPVPNLMFFHAKWLDEKFTNISGQVILQLRPNEKSNLKRLMGQTLNLDRCVAKFQDIVKMLLKAGVKDFKKPNVKDIDSWHQLLVYIIAIIAEHQGWDPNTIPVNSEIKNKTSKVKMT